MKIPKVISQNEALLVAANFVTSRKKPQVIPTGVFLHNGLGSLVLSASEYISELDLKAMSSLIEQSNNDPNGTIAVRRASGAPEKEQIILFPLISSNGKPSADSAEYPLMTRILIQDRLDFFTLIDKDMGGNEACSVCLDEDVSKNYYLTIPSKGLSAIIPLTLYNKYSSVRLMLSALPTSLPSLYVDFMKKIGEAVINQQKAK